jgi:hypothetical protein
MSDRRLADCGRRRVGAATGAEEVMERSTTQRRAVTVGGLVLAVGLAACQEAASVAPRGAPPERPSLTTTYAPDILSHTGVDYGDGNPKVAAYDTCGVDVNVDPAYGPYTFAYTVNGSAVANGEKTWNLANGGSSFWLTVHVTKPNADVLIDSIYVHVVSNARPCIRAYDPDDETQLLPVHPS